MAGPTLSQNEIDRLLSSMKQKEDVPKDDVKPFDFRAPTKFPTAFAREFNELHQAFTRMLSENLTRELRAPVTVEAIGWEQLSYDAYIRSMPNPSILSILELAPLPGRIVLEVSTQLGLILVDRMLGGPGRPVPPRQPTQLEQMLLGAALEFPLGALKETFTGVMDVEPTFITSELNPAFAHAANPTEMVLVLTFSVVVDGSGPAARGLISVCYPLTVLNPIKDAMRQARWSGGVKEESDSSDTMRELLSQTPVELSIRTKVTKVSAADLANLTPGDVVMLDHGVDEPLMGLVESNPFMQFQLGRQGPELAARLENWT
jgi:flagellar motor switch protein FliM